MAWNSATKGKGKGKGKGRGRKGKGSGKGGFVRKSNISLEDRRKNLQELIESRERRKELTLTL